MILCFENFNSNEKIDNRMDEPTYDKFDEQTSYSFDDGGEGRTKRSSSNSLGEGRNEKGNEKRNKE